MSLTTKIWYDENSEPPKNYIWSKGGKLFKYVDGQWKEISRNDADGGGSDIQIVELTYDHLPATGTLSASDLEKLDGDNCLLVMNGKYFRKTFSSDGGIDYKEIGLTTVLGGVRSIYFTASKPDGEYTIAYTYPIEANTQTQANATLENIKVGNTTYSVPLSPMMVEGTGALNDGHFTPNAGMPSFAEARAYMLDGGQVYMIIDTGVGTIVNIAVASTPAYIASYDFTWQNPDSEGGDDYEPQTYVINGSVNSNKEFNPTQYSSTQYLTMKNHYNDGDTIILQFTSPATGVTIKETVVSWTDGVGATTTNGYTWFELS